MTTISPTRVSMYDFLYQDTQPIVSLLADAAQLSLPQTRLALSASLQAIISALLAYQQRHKGQAVSKKLFARGAVKELRQYNAMNFATISISLSYRNDVADSVFGDAAHVIHASQHIAAQISASTAQAKTLLTSLCVIVLRELAILTEYSQLDHNEIDKWFALQPQFLSTERFVAEYPTMITNIENTFDADTDEAVRILEIVPPPFDAYWYKLTGFQPTQDDIVQDMQQATPNYLKAIGRSSENIQQGRHNDMLVFAPMSAIALPHQRWLLQLAKISDIYLSRNRLRITSEPATPPSPPLVSLALIDGNKEKTPTTASEKPIEYDKPIPLWKNPTILIIIVVISILGALAAIKYQIKQSNGSASNAEVTVKQEQDEERKQQDVAIVKINNKAETIESADK